MPDLTFITPVAPYHEHLIPQVQATVAAQTAPCEHLLAIDESGSGPGAVRNRLLDQVVTPYVAFLDADDTLDPAFAAMTLNAVRPARYVYTDWWKDGEIVRVPDKPWCRGSFHLVTALVPTDVARAVRFDEDLPAMEDTDFYLRLLWRGICGIHVPEPLVRYAAPAWRAADIRAAGQRAQDAHTSGEIERIQGELNRRYGGRSLGCCGDETVIDDTPVGERQPGDVLAMALWGGNRAERGRVTGRHYPRTSFPHRTWVDPRDVAFAPHLWQRVPEDDGDGQNFNDGGLRGVDALEAGLMEHGILHPAPPPAPPTPSVKAAKPIPNFRRVKRLAGAARYPTFAAPRKDYPSYRDLWQLVDLAGFELLYIDEVDLDDPETTIIFISPDGIPNCSGARARTVFWQYEYEGDYTEQPNAGTVDEVWSSEPAHAARTGARFVLCGSHRGLNPSLDRGEPQYDVTMLAYMTARREAIQRRLADLTWPPDYPGHGPTSQERHDLLRSTRLMLHVHQHDAPAVTPLRLALAAAYRLPVISEAVPEPGPYAEAVLFTDYDNLPSHARLHLDGKLGTENWGDLLYDLLCVRHEFGAEVLRVLEGERETV